MKANRARADMAGEVGSQPCRGTLAKCARHAGSRGLNLIEAGIVLTILTILTLEATVLIFPELRKARIKQAALDCSDVKKMTRSYVASELKGRLEPCPTIQDLVDAKKLKKDKADDPWGTPFKIACSGGDITVTSAGVDRKFDSPDDIKHDFTRADIKRVWEL